MPTKNNESTTIDAREMLEREIEENGSKTSEEIESIMDEENKSEEKPASGDGVKTSDPFTDLNESRVNPSEEENIEKKNSFFSSEEEEEEFDSKKKRPISARDFMPTSTLEELSTGILTSFFPGASLGVFSIKNGFGLDVNGKIFGGKPWLTDDRCTITNTRFSQNLIAQAIPSFSMTFARTFMPDNRPVNLTAAATSAIIPIINNLTDGRGVLNYGGEKEIDILHFLATLVPLGIELVRPYFPKMEKEEATLKAMDIVDNLANGTKYGSRGNTWSQGNRI